MAATHTTVVDVYVVGPVTAASVIGKVLDVARLADTDHFASYNTTAPVEWGSGGAPAHSSSTPAATAGSTTPCT